MDYSKRLLVCSVVCAWGVLNLGSLAAPASAADIALTIGGSISAAPSTPDVNDSFTVTVTANASAPTVLGGENKVSEDISYSYDWSQSPSPFSGAPAASSSSSGSFATEGTYTIRCTVTASGSAVYQDDEANQVAKTLGGSRAFQIDVSVGSTPDVDTVVVSSLDKFSVGKTGISVSATATYNGNPVSGVTISFSGDLTFSATSAVTDATGVATVTASAGSSPSASQDNSTVTASADDGNGGAVNDGEDFTIVKVNTVSPTSASTLVGHITTNSACSATFTFTISPASSGVPLTFSFEPDSGGTNISASMDSTSANTNDSGQASVTVTSSDTVQSRTVTGTYQMSSKSATVSFDPIAGVTPSAN